MSDNAPANGIRILLVEDEPIVAMLTEDQLENIGCVVIATVATIAEANAAIASLSFDIAMVDINLGEESGLEIARSLIARKIPYIVTSGYAAEALRRDHPTAPVLTKPYAIAELEGAISRCARPRG